MTDTQPNTALLPGIEAGLSAIRAWESAFLPGFEADETLCLDPARLQALIVELGERLQDNYPFFHPLYAGQMLKPPHPAAMIAYLTAMQINPNNHALDGGPATARMEREAVAALAESFGFETHLGHLTASGTIANLEALWIARELHPGKVIAFSEQAHYTHARACELLRVESVSVASTPQGRMDVGALETALQTGTIGTVVVTLGTTALGALDPLAEILALKERYDFRIHIDAAYGGYYHLLGRSDPTLSVFRHIPQVDSLVIDPHKHGLQPYGCGCVIFRDPAVTAIYRHESPYTYYTGAGYTGPGLAHLGEISLECSRSGAAAAALWMILHCFPLQADMGMGAILRKTRQAALAFAEGLGQSGHFRLLLPPELDIVAYFPQAESTSEISTHSQAIFEAGMQSREHPLFAALLNVSAAQFQALHPSIAVDSEQVTLLRSCLMKPEHLTWVPTLLSNLNTLHAQVTGKMLV